MIKFYTDITQLTSENRKRVFPMLFDWFYLENPQIRTHFEWVNSVEQADVCILPIDLGFFLNQNKKNEVNDFITNAKKWNKKVWIYSGGDFGYSWKDETLAIFCFGGIFHSKWNQNTYVMPSFINDPYQNILADEWFALDKTEKPTIGFVGNSDGSLLKLGKELLIYFKLFFRRIKAKEHSDFQRFFPSSMMRFRLLEKLKHSDLVKANFIYRNKYRAGAETPEDKSKTTLEFYQNMQQNLYTFCLRGTGNFSVRFYETLMMGRIPLLIDTDVRLPFHEQINWEEHCVIASTSNFIEKLNLFHNSHSKKEMETIQFKNRQLALNQLNRQNYFIAVSKYLENE